MKLLAIDPGYGRIGFAVMEKREEKEHLIYSECFETKKETEHNRRIKEVGNRMEVLIKEHEPDCVVIEKLFFAKNKKTALRIAEVRGMCAYIAEKSGIKTVEYTPNQIKSAVTGNGNATKKDIIRMVPLLIRINTEKKKHDDEYDAIAAGITHMATERGMYMKNG